MNERKKIMFEIEKFSNTIENKTNSCKPEKNLQISNLPEAVFMFTPNVANFSSEKGSKNFNFKLENLGDTQDEVGTKHQNINDKPIDSKLDKNVEKEEVNDNQKQIFEVGENNYFLGNEIDASFSISSKVNKNIQEDKLNLIIQGENINDINISFNTPDMINEIIQNRVEEPEENKTEENNILTEKKRDSELDDKYNQGRWTPLEHLKFIEAMWLYGNEWKRVQTHIGTRTSSQARSHAQKFFIRLKKKFNNCHLQNSNNIFREENFGIIIEWINESLGANYQFLNPKNVLINYMNNIIHKILLTN
jgi:SHAQKYF class myb-like DNA-binding protein